MISLVVPIGAILLGLVWAFWSMRHEVPISIRYAMGGLAGVTWYTLCRAMGWT